MLVVANAQDNMESISSAITCDLLSLLQATTTLTY